MFEALSDELAGAPSVLVVEDVHWADEATLDVLRVLGRRIESVDALVILTYRDDAVGPVHPVRMLLGDLATAPGLGRVALDPLSPQAVAEMAAGYALDAAELHRLTGGNPFYVHEVLEAGGDQVPATRGRGGLHPRRADERGRPIGAGVGVGGAAGARALGARGGLRRGRGRRWTSAWPAACWSTTTAGRASATSSPGWRSRPSSGRPAGAGCTARCWPRWAIRPEASTRPGWPITPRERTTPLPCCSWRRSPRAVLRRVGAHREAAAQYARALRFAAAQPAAERAELETRLADALYATDDQVESIAARQRAIEDLRDGGRCRAARGTPCAAWSPRTAAAA